MTKVLVLEVHARSYAERIAKKFPELKLVPARDASELPSDLSEIDVLIAFGVAVNDDIIRRLRVLKWIQSLATGVDHFLRFPSLPRRCWRTAVAVRRRCSSSGPGGRSASTRCRPGRP